ncbi:MAG: helix-turn-helix domain-containing protein [Nanoarchaeota archaeon]
MVNKEIFDLLKIGLTEGEAKVYIALTELGSSTVGPIVKKSQVSYSNIYDILNRLTEKGIVSFIIKNKTRHFQAAPPSNLIDYLDKKQERISQEKEALKKVLPELEKLQDIKSKQEAEVFLGKKGLRTAYEKLCKSSSKKDEILFFYIHDDKYGEESNLFYNSITDLVNKTKNRGICNREYKNSWFAKKSKYLTMRFSDLPLPGNIDIITDKILLVSWGEQIFSVLIHSQSLADNLRNYFNEMWLKTKN